MKAIPKSLLIHEVMLHKIINENEWGNSELDSGRKIEKVRLEPSLKIIRDKNNAEVQLATVMFYDCKNSRPNNVVFVEDDIVIFNKQKYQVRIVETLYDRCKIHHYELGLVMYD